jgi:hypothetical protein
MKINGFWVDIGVSTLYLEDKDTIFLEDGKLNVRLTTV